MFCTPSLQTLGIKHQQHTRRDFTRTTLHSFCATGTAYKHAGPHARTRIKGGNTNTEVPLRRTARRKAAEKSRSEERSTDRAAELCLVTVSPATPPPVSHFFILSPPPRVVLRTNKNTQHGGRSSKYTRHGGRELHHNLSGNFQQGCGILRPIRSCLQGLDLARRVRATPCFHRGLRTQARAWHVKNVSISPVGRFRDFLGLFLLQLL